MRRIHWGPIKQNKTKELAGKNFFLPATRLITGDSGQEPATVQTESTWLSVSREQVGAVLHKTGGGEWERELEREGSGQKKRSK